MPPLRAKTPPVARAARCSRVADGCRVPVTRQPCQSVDVTCRLTVAGLGWTHGLHAPRPHRPVGQPALPRHDELRPVTERGGLVRDHGPRARARHQLLRHRQRLRLEARARASPRRSSGAGSPRAAAGASRRCSPPSSTATWATGPTTASCPRCNIRRACDASLRRLQTDYIDLYQMHHVDRATPWDEIWEAMEVLRQQGKILYVGSSNFAGWHIAQAQEAARAPALPRPGQRAVHLQPARRATSSSRCCPAAQDYGLGVIPWSPLHGGLLGGVLRKERGRGAPQGRAAPRRRSRRTATQIEAYEALCDELGRGPGGRRPGLAAAPAGGDRADHRAAHHGAARRSAARAGDRRSTTRRSTRLDEIFPGPGGTAPEAYAW